MLRLGYSQVCPYFHIHYVVCDFLLKPRHCTGQMMASLNLKGNS